ncbi:MAG: hypothetical protein H0W48_00410 [Methylibium sp.]|nr:hypothetical protein [Methylibium sp.]
MTIPTFQQMARDFLKDEDAAAFVTQLVTAAHLWDDLIDRDKPVSATDVRDAFRTLLVTLPANPFYRRNFDQLHPLLDASVISWLTANKFEAAGGAEKLRLAYVIRSDYINVILKCAQLLHGFDYAVRIAPVLRAWWHAEGWDGYVNALREQQGA